MILRSDTLVSKLDKESMRCSMLPGFVVMADYFVLTETDLVHSLFVRLCLWQMKQGSG